MYCPTDLTAAITAGNMEAVKFLLDAGIPVDAFDQNDYSPLMVACGEGDAIETMEFLIAQGANVNLQNEFGLTPLWFAVQSGSIDKIKLLLSNGADINKCNCNIFAECVKDERVHVLRYLIGEKLLTPSDSSNLLQNAVSCGSFETVKYLVEDAGLTADFESFKRACICSRFELAEYLYNRGAPVLSGVPTDDTPIVEALYHHRLDIVILILESNPSVAQELAQSLFKKSCEFGFVDAAKYFVSAYPDVTGTIDGIDLISATISGKTELVSLIVCHYNDLDYETYSGSVALHIAAFHGNLEIVTMLAEHGASVNFKNKDGVTALIMAASGGHLDVIKYLLTQHAEMHTVSRSGSTALSVSIKSLPVVQFLVREGFNIHAKINESLSAVHFAALKGPLEVVKFLISKGGQDGLINWAGRNAFHYACISGDLEKVIYFVEARHLSVNRRDRSGANGLILCIRSWNDVKPFTPEFDATEVLTFLIKHGVDLGGSVRIHSLASRGTVYPVSF